MTISNLEELKLHLARLRKAYPAIDRGPEKLTDTEVEQVQIALARTYPQSHTVLCQKIDALNQANHR